MQKKSKNHISEPTLWICNSAGSIPSVQMTKAGYVDMQNAKLTLAYIFQLVDSYENTADCSLEILHEAARLGHSTYDMSYLILARRNASTLLTVDRKLIKLCQDCGVDVE